MVACFVSAKNACSGDSARVGPAHLAQEGVHLWRLQLGLLASGEREGGVRGGRLVLQQLVAADVGEHGLHLDCGQPHERRAEPGGRLGIQGSQAVQPPLLEGDRRLAEQKVDVVGDARLPGPGRALVRRNDGFDERFHRLVLGARQHQEPRRGLRPLDLGEGGQPFLGQPGQQGDRARAGGEGLERGAARDDWADRHRRLHWMSQILDPLGVVGQFVDALAEGAGALTSTRSRSGSPTLPMQTRQAILIGWTLEGASRWRRGLCCAAAITRSKQSPDHALASRELAPGRVVPPSGRQSPGPRARP